MRCMGGRFPAVESDGRSWATGSAAAHTANHAAAITTPGAPDVCVRPALFDADMKVLLGGAII